MEELKHVRGDDNDEDTAGLLSPNAPYEFFLALLVFLPVRSSTVFLLPASFYCSLTITFTVLRPHARLSNHIHGLPSCCTSLAYSYSVGAVCATASSPLSTDYSCDSAVQTINPLPLRTLQVSKPCRKLKSDSTEPRPHPPSPR